MRAGFQPEMDQRKKKKHCILKKKIELNAGKYKEFQEELCILHNFVWCWLHEPKEKSARISTSPKATMIDDLAVFISQHFLSQVFRNHCFIFSFFLVLPLQLFPPITPHSPHACSTI